MINRYALKNKEYSCAKSIKGIDDRDVSKESALRFAQYPFLPFANLGAEVGKRGDGVDVYPFP